MHHPAETKSQVIPQKDLAQSNLKLMSRRKLASFRRNMFFCASLPQRQSRFTPQGPLWSTAPSFPYVKQPPQSYTIGKRYSSRNAKKPQQAVKDISLSLLSLKPAH